MEKTIITIGAFILAFTTNATAHDSGTSIHIESDVYGECLAKDATPNYPGLATFPDSESGKTSQNVEAEEKAPAKKASAKKKAPAKKAVAKKKAPVKKKVVKKKAPAKKASAKKKAPAKKAVAKKKAPVKKNLACAGGAITRYICSEVVDGEAIQVAYSEPGYCPGGAGYAVEDSRQPTIVPKGGPEFDRLGKEIGKNGDAILFAMKQKRVCKNPFVGLVLRDGAPNGLPPIPPPEVVKRLSGSDTALIVIGSVVGATAIGFGIYAILYATGHAPALHTTNVYPEPTGQ